MEVKVEELGLHLNQEAHISATYSVFLTPVSSCPKNKLFLGREEIGVRKTGQSDSPHWRYVSLQSILVIFTIIMILFTYFPQNWFDEKENV